MADTLRNTQFGGGFNTGCTAAASLLARAYVDYATHNRLCAIQMFVDVTTAFASAVTSCMCLRNLLMQSIVNGFPRLVFPMMTLRAFQEKRAIPYNA
eukprot:4034625-Karenia_brevis.AAC.1